MDNELKPCPFCGEQSATNITSYGKRYYAFCPNCKAYSDSFHDQGKAIEAWNTRQPDPAVATLTAMVEELKAEKAGHLEMYKIETSRVATLTAQRDRLRERLMETTLWVEAFECQCNPEIGEVCARCYIANMNRQALAEIEGEGNA